MTKHEYEKITIEQIFGEVSYVIQNWLRSKEIKYLSEIGNFTEEEFYKPYVSNGCVIRDIGLSDFQKDEMKTLMDKYGVTFRDQ